MTTAAAAAARTAHRPCNIRPPLITPGNITRGHIRPYPYLDGGGYGEFDDAGTAPHPAREARGADGRGGHADLRGARLSRDLHGRDRRGLRHHEADALRLLRLEGGASRRVHGEGGAATGGRRAHRGARTRHAGAAPVARTP